MKSEVYEYISKQTNDPIIERRTCAISGNKFAIYQSDIDFLNKISPTFDGKKYKIPLPTLCPEERERRRMAWRNERKLYKRKCDFSGESIISMFDSNVPFPVYKNKYRWDDSNDVMKFGIDYNPDISFFDQLQVIQNQVPRMQRYTYAENRLVNSEYTNCSGDLKDSYLVFATSGGEYFLYCDYTVQGKYCIDCLLSTRCENCYQCTDIEDCFHVFYGRSSKSCSNCHYIKDCIGCKNCIGCIGLQNKEYYIFNQEYTKEEYLVKKEELFGNNIKFSNESLEKFNRLEKQVPKKNMIGENNDSVYGNYVRNSKNLLFCYDSNNAEGCKYCTFFVGGNNCQDFYSRGESEWCYEISGGGDNAYNNAFTAMCFGVNKTYYCESCFYCTDCFGCVGLRHKQYCIFNKQYTKEEYEKLVAQIIINMQSRGERGEFLPIEKSLFYYNGSVADEYYPLSKEELQTKGYKVLLAEDPIDIPQGIETIDANNLPDNILDIQDDILTKAIICSQSGVPFRITKVELDFYRKCKIPLPKISPKERQYQRLRDRPARHLHLRKCDKCGMDMLSVYDKSSQFKVYCEGCYNKEIY